MPDLSLGVTLSSPSGDLFLNYLDVNSGYKVEKSFREQRQQTFRKQSVESRWVDGSFVVHSVRENVIEQVSVYVYGATHTDWLQKLLALQAAFSQLSYSMIFTYGGTTTEYWSCQPADFTVRTQQEFQVAKMALVQAQVPRLPKVTYSTTTVGIPAQ